MSAPPTATGLSRRRAQPSDVDAPASHGQSQSTTASRTHSPVPSSSNTQPASNTTASRNGNGSGSQLGGEGVTAGHKIAFDERDWVDKNDEDEMPKLTLMEEILLIGLKDKQGYLSFWNDNISYTLRGCILIELALRHRIAMVKDPNRRRFPLADRFIEVINDRLTGEVLLDEALKMMKGSEKMSVGTWIDLMSGETWNVLKIGYQLKQVRERLAKGLVDKGVLRTEKRNFLLFDMATHPVSDPTYKDDVLRRVLSLLTSRTAAFAVPISPLYPDRVRYRTLRAVSMVCAASSANVLENALGGLGYDAREAAFVKCEELLGEFAMWPFGGGVRAQGGKGVGVGGGSGGGAESANLLEIARIARAEVEGVEENAGSAGASGRKALGKGQAELCAETVAAVLEVFRRMDSLLG